MSLEAASASVPESAASKPARSVVEILGAINTNVGKGKDMDAKVFLDDVVELDGMGILDKQPVYAARVKKAGDDPIIYLEAYRRIKQTVSSGDGERIKADLRLAHLLGMDQPSDNPGKKALAEKLEEWNEMLKPVSWLAFGESVRGNGHVVKGAPNEDAFAIENPTQDGDPVIASVADRVSSENCFRSGKGAKLATQTANAVLKSFMR